MVVNSVHWFRKGLRLHDNPALQEALNGADSLRCIYILDPWFAGAANVGINRWRFVADPSRVQTPAPSFMRVCSSSAGIGALASLPPLAGS